MGRRSFSRQLKLEAVKLVREREGLGDSGGEGSGDPKQAFPGRGQMKPDDAEVARLKRELAKTKAGHF